MSHFIERQRLFGSFCPFPAPHPIPLLEEIKYIPKFSRTLIITNHHAEATSYMCIMGNEQGVTRSNAAVFSLSEWISATCQRHV